MAEEPCPIPHAEGGETTDRDMQVEEEASVQEGEPHKGENGDDCAKRAREERAEDEGKVEHTKKPRVNESTEGKERECGGGDEGEKEPAATTASVGPKVFTSAVAMFNYFVKLLHTWTPNLDLNKYEHMVLLDLMKKGHSDPSKKTGQGVQVFQVHNHPVWKSVAKGSRHSRGPTIQVHKHSRCFFIVCAALMELLTILASGNVLIRYFAGKHESSFTVR